MKRDSELMTFSEAARYRRVSERKLRQLVRDGHLPVFHSPLDGRVRLIPRDELDALDRTVTPAANRVIARGVA